MRPFTVIVTAIVIMTVKVINGGCDGDRNFDGECDGDCDSN